MSSGVRAPEANLDVSFLLALAPNPGHLHRTRGVSNHVLRHASEHPAREPGATVRAQDDEIGPEIQGRLHDFDARVAVLDPCFDAEARLAKRFAGGIDDGLGL